MCIINTSNVGTAYPSNIASLLLQYIQDSLSYEKECIAFAPPHFSGLPFTGNVLNTCNSQVSFLWCTFSSRMNVLLYCSAIGSLQIFFHIYFSFHLLLPTNLDWNIMCMPVSLFLVLETAHWSVMGHLSVAEMLEMFENPGMGKTGDSENDRQNYDIGKDQCACSWKRCWYKIAHPYWQQSLHKDLWSHLKRSLLNRDYKARSNHTEVIN